MNSIPVIDLSKVFKNSDNNLKEVAYEIRNALHGIGFVYLTNHGVSQIVVSEGFKASSKFFHLPYNTKEKYRKDHSKSGHGWVQAGRELLNPDSVFELRECFDYAQGDHSPIEECLEFNTTIKNFQNQCNTLIKVLLKLLGIGLELDDPDYFLKCSNHLINPEIPNECDFRSIYYPPIPKDKEIPVGTVRCAAHTDYEIFTLLFQDEIGGLEVKAANGCWVPATPIAGAILVNTGDLLEFWTNGYFPATFHRVIIPEKEIQKRTPRYSFAYFFAPDNDTLVEPLKSNVLESPMSQNAVTAYDHIMKRVREAYQY